MWHLKGKVEETRLPSCSRWRKRWAVRAGFIVSCCTHECVLITCILFLTASTFSLLCDRIHASNMQKQYLLNPRKLAMKWAAPEYWLLPFILLTHLLIYYFSGDTKISGFVVKSELLWEPQAGCHRQVHDPGAKAGRLVLCHFPPLLLRKNMVVNGKQGTGSRTEHQTPCIPTTVVSERQSWISAPLSWTENASSRGPLPSIATQPMPT